MSFKHQTFVESGKYGWEFAYDDYPSEEMLERVAEVVNQTPDPTHSEWLVLGQPAASNRFIQQEDGTTAVVSDARVFYYRFKLAA